MFARMNVGQAFLRAAHNGRLGVGKSSDSSDLRWITERLGHDARDIEDFEAYMKALYVVVYHSLPMEDLVSLIPTQTARLSSY